MPAPYLLSLTGASLLPHAMADVGRVQIETQDWDLTRTQVIERDLLTTARNSTATRRLSELELRLRTLSEEELQVLAEAGSTDLRQLCFVACCRAYPFLRSLTLQLLRPKALSYQYDLRDSDYVRWYEQEAATQARLHEITESTRDKIKSRSMALLAEAGLLDSARSRTITPPHVSLELERLLKRHRPGDLALFLGPIAVPAAVASSLRDNL